MLEIIIGNVCSLIAMITDSLSSTRKRAKEVLLFQTLSQVVYCTSSILLKGYSAAVQNVVSIARNFLATRKETQKSLEWILIGAGVVLGLVFNNRGFWGLLPVIANLEYSYTVFKFKDNEVAIKIAFAVTCAMFVVFNGVILNFVGVVTNLITMVITIVCLFKDIKRRKGETA